MTLYGAKEENAGTYWTDLRAMLRYVRISCGFTQENVASALGVHRATYTNYETGATAPDVIIGKIFRIPPEIFLYPGKFVQGATQRKRSSRKRRTSINPSKLGELTTEERRLIAEFRLKGKDRDV